MKVLQAVQIREADAYTIENEPIISIDLMERASQAFITWFTQKFNNSTQVNIVCGTGNNGGDGLVIGRLLLQLEYKVQVWVIRVGSGATPDFQQNYQRLSKLIDIREIQEPTLISDLQFSGIIIDAIFGSGLARPVTGLFAKVINRMNKSSSIRVAVDIASGLFSDQPTLDSGAISQVHYTVSFQVPKLAFFIPENDPYVGKWQVLDIGLSSEFIGTLKSSYCTLDQDYVSGLLTTRKKYSHKGNFGRALLISGSLGKMGATVLGSRACVRTGVGLLSIHAPRCGYSILQTAIPEAMVSLDEDEHFISAPPVDLDLYQAIGVGPGIDTKPTVEAALKQLLDNYDRPMVVDADAINILGRNRELLKSLPTGSILTPHPKEFERISQKHNDSFEVLESLRDFAIQYQVILVLKGAHTAIASPQGEIFFNTTGNPGMATGGSGDVLTGMITSLVAQGYKPLNAAQLGVYLHGLAGDLGAQSQGEEALLASDMVDHIAQAYAKIKTTGSQN